MCLSSWFTIFSWALFPSTGSYISFKILNSITLMQPSSAIEVEISNIFHWIGLDRISFCRYRIATISYFHVFFSHKEFRISIWFCYRIELQISLYSSTAFWICGALRRTLTSSISKVESKKRPSARYASMDIAVQMQLPHSPPGQSGPVSESKMAFLWFNSIFQLPLCVR